MVNSFQIKINNGVYMKKLISLIAITVVPIALSSVQAETITNASFEDGWSGWTDTDPSALSGEPQEGKKSAKIEGPGGKFEQHISVTENTDYTLTAWVRGKGTIGIASSTGTKTADNESSDWQEVSVSFNAGSNSSVIIFGRYFVFYKGWLN